MAPNRRAPATDQRKAVCLCCRKRLHPSTVWRHAQATATAEALNLATSSRIPASYPRANFALGTRRLTPADDVGGLADTMAAAHLSDDGELSCDSYAHPTLTMMCFEMKGIKPAAMEMVKMKMVLPRTTTTTLRTMVSPQPHTAQH